CRPRRIRRRVVARPHRGGNRAGAPAAGAARMSAPEPATIRHHRRDRNGEVMSTRPRRLRRLLAVPAVVAVVLVVTASAASAHAVLESTTPGPNTNVATSPKAVTLTFSEHVDVRSDAIRLFDSSLSAIDIGSTKHVAGKGDEVTASLPKLKKGLYTVAWRAISADSHPVQGAFTFGVQTSATGSAATKLAAQAQATEKSDATVGVLLGVTRFGVFVGLALLIGIVGFVLFLWPSGRVSVRVRQVLYAG